ncbi:MAG: hypothetical protein ACREBI_03020 [Nitrosotalea sp.]
MNEIEAKEIARKFLEQHFSIIIAHAVLKGDEWIVTAKVGFSPDQVKKVVIHTVTGKIERCY